jgi:deoxyribodipyrimidine photo-lyase
VVALLEKLRAGVAAAGGTLTVWSHEETGNAVTFARDRAVGRWAREQGVRWTEFPQNGVVRRLRSRDGWAQGWNERMGAPVVRTPEKGAARAWPLKDAGAIPTAGELGLAPDACEGRQSATRAEGVRQLETFLGHRGKNYNREMSSPLTAAESCSRLSLALACGTLSLREIAQASLRRLAELQELRKAGGAGEFRIGALRAFVARLHWHCHFMQKLESEPRIEFTAFVPALDALRGEEWTAGRAEKLAAWAEGRTGYPFVDACMRSLRATGWINFRMRAMLMSFASYDLWLPWRRSGLHLARLFTDYEPGIHWPQVQMQSGTTGINTLRMYSPVKQSHDQDGEGVFIRRWVPELAAVSAAFVHEPWRMPTVEQERSGCVVGRDYPRPVVDHAEAVKFARAKFTEARRSDDLRAATGEVLRKHGSRKRTARKTAGRRGPAESPPSELELDLGG